MPRADHGHLTTYSRRIVDLFENPTAKKRFHLKKRFEKGGWKINEFSFWEGLPVGAMFLLGVHQKIYSSSSQKKHRRAVSSQIFSRCQDFIQTSGNRFSPVSFGFSPVLAEPFFEDYVSTDLKRLDAEPAELLSNRPMDDPLEQRGRCFEGVGLIWVG